MILVVFVIEENQSRGSGQRHAPSGDMWCRWVLMDAGRVDDYCGFCVSKTIDARKWSMEALEFYVSNE